MTPLIRRTGEKERFSAFLADGEGLRAALGGNDPTVTIETWLRRLRRLNGVPFNYLVPSERMLPNESIRFFNVDFNWLFALIEGACSIGQSSELDDALHALTAPRLRAAAAGEQPPDAASGFLLRSQVVAGWPKLEIVAHDAAGAELTDILRMERISDSILLFLVQGRIDRVIIREPAIGIHFGIAVAGGKPLRYVTVPADAPEGIRPGDQIDNVSITPQYRDPAHRTLRIGRLAGDLSDTLYAQDADNAPDGARLPFTSAEFALQLVEGTQEVTFQNGQKEDG